VIAVAVADKVVPYPRALARFPEVRQSTLATFDQCALLSHFDMSYRRGWSTHPQGRGRLFHRFAGEALRAMKAEGEQSIDVTTAIGILEEVLTQKNADRVCPSCGSEKVLPGLTKRMERACGNCGELWETEFVNCSSDHVKDLYMTVKKWAHDNSFDIRLLVDVEKRLRATVHYSVDGVGVDRVLTGQPDVLMLHPQSAEHVIVIDWKDTWALPPISEVSEEGYFQQRFYAWLVMHNYRKVEGVTLREFYVRRSQVREATLWRHDLDHLDATFAALVERFDRQVEEQVFLPSPGAHCSFCIRPEKCPIPVFARGDGTITTERRAKQVAAQLVVAKRVVAKAERSLKAWCKGGGEVEVKDGKGKRVYGYVEQGRTSRPTREELEEAVMRSGGALTTKEVEGLYKEATVTKFVDHAPPRDVELGDEDARLLESLAKSIQRAAERKGLA
jgi:hypothetical protein